jgi:hypothetical protein
MGCLPGNLVGVAQVHLLQRSLFYFNVIRTLPSVKETAMQIEVFNGKYVL